MCVFAVLVRARARVRLHPPTTQAAQEGEAAARRALQATKGAAKEAHASTAEATEQTIRDLSGQISELRLEHQEVCAARGAQRR